MWSTIMSLAAAVTVAASIPCDEAQLRCAYRDGCGKALQNYWVACSGVLQGPEPTHCPSICETSLIALVSTEEGKALMECECGDSYCHEQKHRSEICKPNVMKIMDQPVIPCRTAESICNADVQCSTAFDYYQTYCRAMFHGKKCSSRCHNSINILLRQEKAKRLRTCRCDGTENYNCHAIQRNMDKLCFHSNHHHYNGTRPKVHVHYDDTPKVIMASTQSSSDSVRTVGTSAVILATSLVLMLTR